MLPFSLSSLHYIIIIVEKSGEREYAMSEESKWILFNFQMSPEMKYSIEDQAFKLKLTQSQLVRFAIEEFLESHAETEQEKEFAELVARQRKERLGLMRPKDGFRTEMQISGAWQTIQKAKKEYKDMGILASYHYDLWIRRLEENIESLDSDNPAKEVAVKSYRALIEILKAEKAELLSHEVRKE